MSRLYDALTAIERRAPQVVPQTDLPGATMVAASRRGRIVLGVVGGVAIVAAAVAGVVLALSRPRPPAPMPVTAVQPAAPSLLPTAVGDTVNVADIRARARQAASRNALAEAEALLDRAVATAPTDADCWNDLGVVRVRRGQLRAGIAAFERGVAVQPANADLQRNLAVALDRDGQRAAALTHYRAFLALAPRHPDRAAVERRVATP